jgi:hypothetical protein
MRFFPRFIFVDEIPESDIKTLRNAHLYSNIGGTYNFRTKVIHIKRNTGQGFTLVLHELGHWFIAIFTKSDKVHTWYDSRHLNKNKRCNNPTQKGS